MSETELLLFSGGPDSTILLKDFLQKGKKIRVLYIEMGWSERMKARIPLQNKAVENVLDYLRKTYGDFEYSKASIHTSMNNHPEDEQHYFGKDDQWCMFFAGMFCRNYNIKKMWLGNFTYTTEVRRARDGTTDDWKYDGQLNGWLESGARHNNVPEYCTPKTSFRGTDIDSFKTKKEAWDSLEPALKHLVRSCTSDQWYCGKCSKCWTAQHYKLRDNVGKPL